MASKVNKPSLSPADKAILNRIFSPHLPYADVIDEDEEEVKDTGS